MDFYNYDGGIPIVSVLLLLLALSGVSFALGVGTGNDRYINSQNEILNACAKAHNVYQCHFVAVPMEEK